ncbi:MAG: replication-associated recombination protein A [Pseudomonadota bacterium]|nr:replication-associated recombination protein A [Pseudomonadota bacterium]
MRDADAPGDASGRPLADRMRPRTLDTFAGQRHLLGEGRSLRRAIVACRLHSMVFWGPPGSGKTTLARIIAGQCHARFETLSAVTSGVRDIRAAVSGARESLKTRGERTVLFVDEAHRFNKAQQDAFLPHIEDGTVIFMGATTENPSFELNNALLSRVRVYTLKPLGPADIRILIDRALADPDHGLGAQGIEMAPELRDRVSVAADGDARRACNLLEIAADLATESQSGRRVIGEGVVAEVARVEARRFDRGGDIFHEQISALHKSVRGSDPDAALYWVCRMLDGGCDPAYIARRLTRIASEDIGNADPRALRLALDAWETWERLGSPEGELAIAQAVIYLACAAKSNAVYRAFGSAMEDVRGSGSLDVPLHLRNAPTRLMRSMEYGKGYRDAHGEQDALAAGEHYFPESLGDRRYYEPVPRGLEKQIQEKLAWIRERNREAIAGK